MHKSIVQYIYFHPLDQSIDIYCIDIFNFLLDNSHDETNYPLQENEANSRTENAEDASSSPLHASGHTFDN